MSYNQKKTLQGFDETSETNVDTLERRPPLPLKKTAWSEQYYDVNAGGRSPASPYDEFAPPSVPPRAWSSRLYDIKPTKYEDLPPKPSYKIPHPVPSTPWSAQQYDVSSNGRSLQPRHSPAPWDEKQYELDSSQSDDYVQIATTVHEMEFFRLRQDGNFSNPVYSTGDYIEVSEASSVPAKPIYSPSYFQRFKTFVWSNAQRRIATVVITSLIIGGIISAYLGLSHSTSPSTPSTPTASPSSGNCTYPEGVNSTFLQLQETLGTVNSSLSIPGLDSATCSLISMVINNTVSALKMGGYNCWQNVQSALMPLASSAIALNMDSIQQIITSVKQYCFSSSTTTPDLNTTSTSSTSSVSSSTAMTSFAPVTSPANTVTTFTTTPMTSAPTTITTTTTTKEAGTTALTTSTTTPTSMITTTVTSTTPTTLQTTSTSLVTTSTGTTTLAPLTTTAVPAGTTTITTLEPTSTSTVFVSSSTSSTITTSSTSLSTSTTTTTTGGTATTTTSTTTTLPCCQFNQCIRYPFVGCRCRDFGLCSTSRTALCHWC